jgi:phosphatidylserine decarboxylase
MSYKSKYGHYEPIAREALPFLIPLILAAILFCVLELNLLSLVSIILGLYVAAFFRNPERVSYAGDNAVLSPADGKVVEVLDNARPTIIDGKEWRRVSVFMSLFNVHVNRAPISGRVESVQAYRGSFLDARNPESSSQNERSHMVISTGDFSIEVAQIAGLVARRIACWAKTGDELKRGERYGLIRFGSRLDIYVPSNMRIEVSPGDRVKAGLSVIAIPNGPQDKNSE